MTEEVRMPRHGPVFNDIEIRQSTASRHLKILENAEIISSKRVGKFVYYAIARQDDEEEV